MASDEEDFHWTKQSGHSWKNGSGNITDLRNIMGKPDFSTVFRLFLGAQEWEGHCGLARPAPQAACPMTFPVTEQYPEISYLRKREWGSPSHLLGAESCFHWHSSLAAQKLSNAAGGDARSGTGSAGKLGTKKAGISKKKKKKT